MEPLLQNVKSFIYKKPLTIMTLAKTTTRKYATQKASSVSKSASSKSIDVPGLSSAVYKLPSEPVGPGASKSGEYKNPEYFCYNKTSYFEAEIEMLKYRLPQPSSKGKN